MFLTKEEYEQLTPEQQDDYDIAQWELAYDSNAEAEI